MSFPIQIAARADSDLRADKMWYIALILGSFYGLYHSFASFYEPLKNSKYYLLIISLVAALAGLSWGLIAKYSSSATNVYKAGSAHDGALLLVWYVGSLFVFNIKLGKIEYFGLFLILIGTLLLKGVSK